MVDWARSQSLNTDMFACLSKHSPNLNDSFLNFEKHGEVTSTRVSMSIYSLYIYIQLICGFIFGWLSKPSLGSLWHPGSRRLPPQGPSPRGAGLDRLPWVCGPVAPRAFNSFRTSFLDVRTYKCSVCVLAAAWPDSDAMMP